MTHRAWDDDERHTNTITGAARSGEWWDIRTDDGFGCGLPVNSVIDPKPGDTLTLWGRGFGYQFRGQAVNDTVVWYRTEEEQRAHNERDLAEREANQRATYAANLADHDRRIAALPTEFQQRIAGFRERNPDFGWKHEAYELFVCEQAVAFAAAFPTPDALQSFHEMPYERQKAACTAMDDGHSGNTFGAAVRLAHRYLTRPDTVPKEHGALCPLVGCADYGCWAASNEAVAA